MNKKQPGVLVVNGPLRPAMGGVATFLSHVLPYLVEKGMEVHTVIDRRPEDPAAHDWCRQKGVHVHYCSPSRWMLVLQLLKFIRLWFMIFRQSGGQVFVSLKSYKSIVRWIGVCEEIVQNFDIDYVHAYDYPWVQGWVARYLARKYRKQYFQTTYGEVTPHKDELTIHDNRSAHYRALVHDVLGDADLIMSCSKHCARELAFVGFDPSVAKIMYHGIDTDAFRPGLETSVVRSRYQLDDRRIVLFVGQIRQRKGPQVLLEAVPSIVRHIPDALVCFAGPDYGMVPRLKARSQELGVESHVQFPGPIEEENLPNLYNACEVFVFPSCTPIECLGLTTVQAMACGKPAVGSRINGVPEVIDENVTGFLVEPNDPTALADKIVLLLQDDSLRSRMGSEGIKRARSVFHQSMLADTMYRLYVEHHR